jgi:tripartite-type tricarboxylate transporter receptor subunit TctC
VVVNKAGAGGSVAAADVIGSKPDGYKLMITTNFFFATTTKTQKVPFDPTYLTPLVNIKENIDGLCVRGDSPWKTFNDLVAYAKKNPNKLTWAHTGRGIVSHIAVLLLFRKAGVETIDVPYKGTPEKATALLGGHVDASGMTLGAVKDLVEAGKVRFLTFISDRRLHDLPNVPTVVELGYPELGKMTVFSGFYVHRDTPEAIRKILTEAFKKTCDEPDFKKKMIDLGEVPRFEGPETIKEAIKKGEEMAVPILKELGLYVAQ